MDCHSFISVITIFYHRLFYIILLRLYTKVFILFSNTINMYKHNKNIIENSQAVALIENS